MHTPPLHRHPTVDSPARPGTEPDADNGTQTGTQTGTGTGPASRRTRTAVAPRPGLAQRLDAEWQVTCRAHDELALRWAREVPVLEGCTRLDDVVACCADSDPACVALLTRAQGGCPVAGRTLLRALTPLLAGLARRDPRADLGDYLGASWPVVMGRSLERRTCVLAGLALDTRRALVRERAGVWVTTLADSDLAARLTDTAIGPHPLPPGPDPDAAGLVEAARRLRLLPEASAATIEQVYVHGRSGRETAERLGMSEAMVRYRCSSGVRRLRENRASLLDDITA